MIDRRPEISLYMQVEQDVVRRINSGQYRVGEPIPSQRALADIYGVSEITVRKALDLLVSRGYLQRIQGKGTFVTERKINRVLNLMSYTEEMRSKGLDAETKVLQLELLTNDEIAKKLGIFPSQEIVKVERLRLIDGKPHALQTSYLPAHLVSFRHLQKMNQSTSLYEILKQINICPAKAQEVYHADLLRDAELCNLLEAKAGDPVLIANRYTYSEDNVLFEYAYSILKGNMHTIEVVLTS